jgi:uncharacterized membrane protein YhaH (DUF805 family)
MLGFIFGFNARLGRLHYFLATVALAFVMTGICFVIAWHVFESAPRGTLQSESLMTWPTLVAIAFFALATFTLQSMRIRDIGWDPVCVIPGWFVVLLVDMVVAKKFPSLSLGAEHHGTAVGALVNLALFLALLFWPSAHHEEAMPSVDEPRRPDPARGSGAASVAAERIARASGDFGRRAY